MLKLKWTLSLVIPDYNTLTCSSFGEWLMKNYILVTESRFTSHFANRGSSRQSKFNEMWVLYRSHVI